MFLARKLAGPLLTIALLVVPIPGHSTELTSAVLTNAADILALSPDRASHLIPVSITGVVTAAEPGWAGRFFIQDASGGVFVDNARGVAPQPGDLVTVTVRWKMVWTSVFGETPKTARGTRALP